MKPPLALLTAILTAMASSVLAREDADFYKTRCLPPPTGEETPATTPATPWSVVLNFGCVAIGQEDQGRPSSPERVKATCGCLSRAGVVVEDATLPSQVALVDNREVYQSQAAAPTGGRILMQLDQNGPISYTLRFDPPLHALILTRPKLLAGESGITHPAWSVHALNANGTELTNAGEDLIASKQDVEAQTFQLNSDNGQRIFSARFDSDGRALGRDGKLHPFAAFSAVLIERAELARDRMFLKGLP